MTSGFDAFSLGLFTSLAPAGVVAFLALALVRLWSRDRTAQWRIDRMIALPFSVVLIGFIASATHLGRPRTRCTCSRASAARRCPTRF